MAYSTPIQPPVLFAGWRKSTTNHIDIQLRQIFVIPNVTKKIKQNYQKWTACSNTEVFVDESGNLYIAWIDVTESMATTRSPFCEYNLA